MRHAENPNTGVYLDTVCSVSDDLSLMFQHSDLGSAGWQLGEPAVMIAAAGTAELIVGLVQHLHIDCIDQLLASQRGTNFQ